MTVYYDSKDPLSRSITQWNHTSVKSAVKRPEFWFYFFGHATLVYLVKQSGAAIEVDWKASGAIQYFTTFFLTFYNGHCFARYEMMYPACMDALEGVNRFVFELTVSFKHPDLWNHRLKATKYLLASLYLFFMSITNDGFTSAEWAELVKKGLLTKEEAGILRGYAGPDHFPVLATWAFYVCNDGMEQDCMWEERSQKIAHLHNRLDKALAPTVTAMRKIAQMMALPIPFAYWHLMNLVFALNFLLLSGLMASFASWMTIVPYSMALLIFMGLREVSNALADPFGQDTVDFPIVRFLDHTFDQCICLLQAFSHESAYAWTKEKLKEASHFAEGDVRHSIEKHRVFNENYRPHIDSPHHWSRTMPLQRLIHKTSVASRLRGTLAGLIKPDAATTVNTQDIAQARREEAIQQNKDLTEQLRQVEVELESMRASYAYVKSVLPGASADQPQDLARTREVMTEAKEAIAQADKPLRRPRRVHGSGLAARTAWAPSRGASSDVEVAPQGGGKDADETLEAVPEEGEEEQPPPQSLGRAIDLNEKPFTEPSFTSFDDARRQIRASLARALERSQPQTAAV